MSKRILFTSMRPLGISPDINDLLLQYQPNEADHVSPSNCNFNNFVCSNRYDILVTDDFPAASPGKAILVWHGIQGGKTIGLDQPGRPYYNPLSADKITYIISASHDMVPIWSRCTGVPKDHILPLGSARTDKYFGKKKGDGHTLLANRHTRSYLFVPTFRDRLDGPYPSINWREIDDELNDDETLYVKVHPWEIRNGSPEVYTDLQTCAYRHIVTVDARYPTERFLYDADVVITDYSSVMFDAYILGKPVVLFEKAPGYTERRGMYLKYPEQYNTFCARDEGRLVDMIRFRYHHSWLTDTEEECKRIVADMCDGHSCERICNFINSLKGDTAV